AELRSACQARRPTLPAKDHITGLLPVRLAPFEIETSIACGDIVLLREAQPPRGAIDPMLGAFQFQIHSDRRLVQDRDSGTTRLSELGAVFLISEYRTIIEALENGGNSFRTRQFQFDLLTALVPAPQWLALVREGRFSSGNAHPQQAGGL